MVKASSISQYNTRFASEDNAGLVIVFAGATSGTGACTLEKMAVMLQAPTFYVIGRSTSRFASQRAKLESLNPSCKLVFLEAEVSLLSDVDTVCQKIAVAEKKVDCLYMSPGCIPLNGPQCTCLLFLDFQMLTGCIRHEGGPRNMFRNFVLLQDAADIESSAPSSSSPATSCFERPQRWQGAAHA